ncbi:unnamed protein product, partial [Medioppia subpectinata]
MKAEVQELSRERVLCDEYRNRYLDQNISDFVLSHKRVDESVATFDDLDDDVILHIFAQLENLVDQTVLELVCKRWQSLMARIWSTRSHLSFTSTFFRFEAPALKSETLFAILKKCLNLKSIDLKHVTNFLDFKALEIIGIICLFLFMAFLL